MAATVNVLNTAQGETTNNATFKNIIVIPTTNNSSAGFTVNIGARRLSDGASQSWFTIGQYKNINGVVTANFAKVGTTIGTNADKTALSSTDIQITQSGDQVFIQVKGLAATNIIWSAKIDGAEVFDLI